MVDVLTPIIGFIAIVVALFLLSGIRVLREWERMPVLRLGRYVGLKGPGIIYLVPLIDRAPLKISTQTRHHTVPNRIHPNQRQRSRKR